MLAIPLLGLTVLSAVKPHSEAFDLFLHEAREEVLVAMIREKLVEDGQDHSQTSDTEFYCKLFEQLPESVYHVLEADSLLHTVESLHKAIMIATIATPYTEFVNDACKAVGWAAYIRKQMRNSVSLRWLSICKPAGGIIQAVRFFRFLSANEMYVLMKTFPVGQFPVGLINDMISDNYANEHTLTLVRQFPPEIEPVSHALCLSLRMKGLCNQFFDELSRVEPRLRDIIQRISSLRAALTGVTGVTHIPTLASLQSTRLVYELDYLRVPHADIILSRALAHSKREIAEWPLLDRLLRAPGAFEQSTEYLFAVSGLAKEFIGQLKAICTVHLFTLRRCWHLAYDKVPSIAIGHLVQNPQDTPKIALRYLLFKSETRLSLFMAARRRLLLRGNCEICQEPFRSSAIELCPPSGEFCGHHICRDCAVGWLEKKNEYSCPFCKRIIQGNESTTDSDMFMNANNSALWINTYWVPLVFFLWAPILAKFFV